MYSSRPLSNDPCLTRFENSNGVLLFAISWQHNRAFAPWVLSFSLGLRQLIAKDQCLENKKKNINTQEDIVENTLSVLLEGEVINIHNYYQIIVNKDGIVINAFLMNLLPNTHFLNIIILLINNPIP